MQYSQNRAGIANEKATLKGWLSFGEPGGERRKRCPSGAFAKGKSDLNESIETSSRLMHQQSLLRRLRLRIFEPTTF